MQLNKNHSQLGERVVGRQKMSFKKDELIQAQKEVIERLSAENALLKDKGSYLAHEVLDAWGCEGYMTIDIKNAADSFLEPVCQGHTKS